MPEQAGAGDRLHDPLAAHVPVVSAVESSAPPLRVLVSGASSQLGHALLPMLRAGDHRVHALSRDAHAGDDRVHWHRVDLTRGWPERLPVCDVLVSFGPLQALAEALAGLDAAPCARLVATSSMSAESKRVSPVAAERALAAAMRAAESALIDQCTRLGIGWTLLRPTMIWGVGRDRNLTPIARRALRLPVFPYPLGNGLRQPVHAEDVATAAWRAARAPAVAGRIIEIGGGEALTVSEMFRRVHASLPGRRFRMPIPGVVMRLAAALSPGLRGFVSRIDQDLLADNRALTTLLGLQPRGFAPSAGNWRATDA